MKCWIGAPAPTSVLNCLFSINHNAQRHFQQFDHWDIIWFGGTTAGFCGLRGLCARTHGEEPFNFFRFGHHPSQKIKVGGTWSLLSLHVCGRRLPSQLSRDRDVAENGQNMFTNLKMKKKFSLVYYYSVRLMWMEVFDLKVVGSSTQWTRHW